MLISELEFEKEHILNVKQAIEGICLHCRGIGILCGECPVDNVIDSLISMKLKTSDNINPLIKKEFELLTEGLDVSFSELIFDKNKVFVSQDSLESLCENCQGAGILCDICHVHEIRRTLASLPVIDSEVKFSSKPAKKSAAIFQNQHLIIYITH